MKYVKKEPIPMKIIDAYFLIRTITSFLGVILFLTNYFYITRFGIVLQSFSFMFGELTLFAISPLIPLLHGIAFAVAFRGLRKDIGIARLLAIVLLFIDVFAFPVGTVLCLGMIVYLAHPATVKYFTPIAKKNIYYRAIGLGIIAISLVGFFFTSGLSDSVLIQTEEPKIMMSAEDKIDNTIDITSDETVEVIVELSYSTSMMQSVSLQSVLLQDIMLMGGEPQGSVYRVLNAIDTKISADKLVEIAKNPNVKRIIKNEPVIQLWGFQSNDNATMMRGESFDDCDGDGIPNYKDSDWDGLPCSEAYVWEPIRKLWGISPDNTGKGIVIAVVDSGIDASIPALQRDGKSVVIDSYELYGDWVHWHGTAVASVIASQGTEEYPNVKGIAPGVDLLDVEVFLPSGQATYFDIIKGWEWVVNWKEAHPDRFVICSNSLGVPSKTIGILDVCADNMALLYGIPMVVASGNMNPQYRICSPGMGRYVLTVGAVDENGHIAPFSCRGPAPEGIKKPDVCALGVDVPAFEPSDSLFPDVPKEVSGTSFSTPIVAGAIALLVEKNPQGYSIQQIYDAIRNGAKDAGPKGFDYDYGYGIVNLEGAILSLKSEKPTRYYVYMFALLPLIGIVLMFYPEIDRKLAFY